MANLREITGRSMVSRNLAQSEWTERDVDRVAAMGAAGRITPLGVEVFRWYYAKDARAAIAVLNMLMRRIGGEFSLPISFREGICKQAMQEFSDFACRTCEGRGSVVLHNGVKLNCQQCQGTGIRRYSDKQRLHGSGFAPRSVARIKSTARTTYDVVGPPLERAIDLLRKADGMCNVQLNIELERTKVTG